MIQTKEQSRVADYLKENNRIGSFITNYSQHRRYVDLRKNDMFEALKSLYKHFFSIHWGKFDSFVKGQVAATSADADKQNFDVDYVAAVYASAWFHDLYVTNRRECRKLWDEAFSEVYSYDPVFKLDEYDPFLAHLNKCIRPTNVKYTHEDKFGTLFIPRVSSVVNLDDPRENYFDITGYGVNDSLLHGLVLIMKVKKLANMVPLPVNTSGRPVWLFDWHDDGLCYAWFPAETNYNPNDVSIAYIIGVACSPKLGPRDRDEWQDFPGNIVPQDLGNLRHADRVCPLSCFGSVMCRVIETRAYRLPDSIWEQAIPKEITRNEIAVPALNQFRIVDYMYHAGVVEHNDKYARFAAFRMFTNPQSFV